MGKQKRKRVAVKDTKALRRADWERIAQTYLPPTRKCVGGRLVASGHVCLHCDSTAPTCWCEQPVEERRDCPRNEDEYWDKQRKLGSL